MSTQPVWIKYWGIVPMTRRGYLISLAAALLLVLAIFIVAGSNGRLPPIRSLWEELPLRPRAPWWEYWFYNNLYRICVLLLLGQAMDTFVVLRRFARKEAERNKVAANAAQPLPGKSPEVPNG